MPTSTSHVRPGDIVKLPRGLVGIVQRRSTKPDSTKFLVTLFPNQGVKRDYRWTPAAKIRILDSIPNLINSLSMAGRIQVRYK